MNAAYRQLYIFQQLLTGQSIVKSDLVQKFEVDPRVIQRDISQIRQFIADQGLNYELEYHRKINGYILKSDQDEISKQAILILIKILLASRSLNKKESEQTIEGLLKLINPSDRNEIEPIIKNERFYYIPVHHKKNLLQMIWQFNQFILKKQTVTISYQKQDRSIVERTILPEALIFSEYYFYVISYNAKYDSNLFYRIDRIQDWHTSHEKITRSYAQRYEDGKLRQNIHYMYPGEKMIIQFEYWGIVEAALDRFPNSKVIKRYPERNSVLIEAEVFDYGAEMWLLSQGDMVKAISPQKFVDDMVGKLKKMLERY